MTSSKVTSLLEVTIFFVRLIDLKTSFLRTVTPETYIKSTFDRVACIKDISSGYTCIEVVSIEDAYTWSFYIIDTSRKSICLKDKNIISSYVRSL